MKCTHCGSALTTQVSEHENDKNVMTEVYMCFKCRRISMRKKPAPKDKVKYELGFCEKCYQMTNHVKGVCQKCK